MPFGGGLSLAGSAIGIGSSLAGLFGGGGANSINVPQPYQYQNMGGADTNAYQGIGNLAQYNTYGQLLPQAQGIGQGLVNNPYAGGYQSGAGQAGGMYQGAGQNAYAQGGALGQSATGALGGVNSLLQMGFDPQSALYNQLQGQNSQQYNAQNAASGIAGTPYGASVADQANNNFNLQWQNAQLGRAARRCRRGRRAAWVKSEGRSSRVPGSRPAVRLRTSRARRRLIRLSRASAGSS